MEKVTTLRVTPHVLWLETDASSVLIVFIGGAIIKCGFWDAPDQAVKGFSHRLYYHDGVIFHELNNHRGTIQQIPVAQADDNEQLRVWLEKADQLIP